MNPAQALAYILEHYGVSVAQYPRQLHGLLRDACTDAQYTQQLNLLVLCAEVGVPQELLAMPVDASVMQSRLQKRLYALYGVRGEVAAQGVQGGARGLKVRLPVQPVAATVAPVVVPPVAAKPVNELDQGVWTDPKTGMMWMRHSMGQTWDGKTVQGEAKKYNWAEAHKAVEEMNKNGGFAGYTDWQLPHIEDLASLLRSSTGFEKTTEIHAKQGGTVTVPSRANDGHQRPTIDQNIFPNTPSDWYWSASPNSGYNDYAWYVDFYDGYSDYHDKSNDYLVRAVRASQ